MKSIYAAVVRAAYEHPVNGDQVFRISPDTSRKAKEQNSIESGTLAERPFDAIWRAMPEDVRAWACGRLAADEPKHAAELLEDVAALDTWHPDPLGRRGRFLVEHGGRVMIDGHVPMEGVHVREDGNVVHSDTGELVDLEA